MFFKFYKLIFKALMALKILKLTLKFVTGLQKLESLLVKKRKNVTR
jgi:hypothetical protein